jgi:glyoxylase-like metal-dependent hydrolase (beta-lactamase superfamily II)
MGVLATWTSALAQIEVSPQALRTADAAVRGFIESDFPRLHHVADNMYVIEDLYGAIGSNTAFTTNVMFVVTPEGVVVLDGLDDEERTGIVVEMIADITEQPIRYVVIGADHVDHVGGNNAFPSDATFIAHPLAIERLEAMDGLLPVPQEAVSDRRTLELGGVEMEILFLGPAHTGSDLVVHFPQQDILWASETFFTRIYPSVGGGLTAHPHSWLDVIRQIEAMDIGLVLPNHGFIYPAEVLREELVSFRRCLENLISEATRMYEAGIPAEQAPYQMNIGEFAYWYRAAANLPNAVAQVYRELDGAEIP